MSRAEDVLEFWFATPAVDAEGLRKKIARWYMGGPALDREIAERFGSLVEDALAGKLDDWAATVHDRLALILLLDQFTRSIFRDEPRMYAGDTQAQALAVDALDRHLDRQLDTGLGLEQRQFLVMPLMHAEDLALQERTVVELGRIVDDAPPWAKPVFGMGLEQAHKYRAVIARFGRFPHRNAILGRASTPDEEAFLVDWKERQPPAAAKDLPKP